MKGLKIACLGEAMVEMIANADANQAQLGVAGDTLNTAIYLKRNLGTEHTVAFVSMVGTDAFSDRIQTVIAQEDISTDLLKRHRTKLPGLYSISTNEYGERSFAYWRSASAARDMFMPEEGVPFSALNAFDVIFTSAITLAILPQSSRDAFFDWLKRFRANGGLFIFDSNYRPALWEDVKTAQTETARAWQHCDIALPSVDDEMALFKDNDQKDVLRRLIGYGVREGVLKRGEQGPLPIIKQKAPWPTFGSAKHVIDTTAAGDSFNGGFISAYLLNQDTAAAAQAGHALACKVVAHPGAILPKGVS